MTSSNILTHCPSTPHSPLDPLQGLLDPLLWLPLTVYQTCNQSSNEGIPCSGRTDNFVLWYPDRREMRHCQDSITLLESENAVAIAMLGSVGGREGRTEKAVRSRF